MHSTRSYHYVLMLLLALGAATLALAAPPAALPPATLMTDPANSAGDVGLMAIHTQLDTASFSWYEDGGSGEEWDLFYRAAPNAPAQLLSDRTLSQGTINYLYTVRAYEPGGAPHFAWMEYIDAKEGYDLFYWNPTAGVLHLTDQSQTEGIFTSDPLILALDDHNRAHVFWRERNATDTGTDYFYWNQTLGTTNMSALLGESISSGSMVVSGTAAHLVWNNADTDFVYWNSNDQMKITVPRLDLDAYGGSKYPFAEDDGSVTVYWSEGLTSQGYTSENCLIGWNSNTKTTDVKVKRPNCIGIYSIEADSNGRIHLVGGSAVNNDRQIFYWNSAMSEENVFWDHPMPTQERHVLMAEDGSVVHITWLLGNSAAEDLYHWDSVKKTAANLSSSMGPNTNIRNQSTQWALGANGTLLVLWWEQPGSAAAPALYYWHSTKAVTQLLQDLFTMDDFDPLRMRYAIDGKNRLHFSWWGMPATGNDGFFYLNDAQQQVIRISSELQENRQTLFTDLFNVPHLVWFTDAGFYHWDGENGVTDLTATTAVETVPSIGSGLNYAVDEMGQVYVLWAEESDTPGEGTDLYAAWTAVDWPYRVLLPIISYALR